MDSRRLVIGEAAVVAEVTVTTASLSMLSARTAAPSCADAEDPDCSRRGKTSMSRKRTAALAASGLALVLGATAMTLGAPAASAATAMSAAETGSPEVQAASTYTGTFQAWDGCIILKSARGYNYGVDAPHGYQVNPNNGGLYGPHGFIAYPGKPINVYGKRLENSGGTTLCANLSGWIKASSITKG
jgi:hypothetical protein